jgi:hypothetical protein
MEAADDQQLTIANEFTTIRVRKVRTRNGERLEIRSPKLGFVTYLDPLELECLTWQPPETFSELLESPYGPEEDVEDIRPLSELMVLEAGRPDSWKPAGQS